MNMKLRHILAGEAFWARKPEQERTIQRILLARTMQQGELCAARHGQQSSEISKRLACRRTRNAYDRDAGSAKPA